MAKSTKNKVPSVSAFYNPTTQALKELGGSGNIHEINEMVYKIMDLPDEVLDIPHENDARSKVEYRLAWARTRLKLAGIIENSARGVWSIVDTKVDLNKITPTSINQKSIKTIKSNQGSEELEETIEEEGIGTWKENLLKKLYTISSDAFERLAQRMLRESGFIEVEVTGRSGDGGIDGKGILLINGFLRFHVIFQCKRWKGSISPKDIRSFRGAMQGRTDYGLFITTGKFTREAIKEATRDGAPNIDLVNGDLLCDKLKALSLGVRTELVENVKLDLGWFDKI